jgi:prepilin-type N-terminal cleavage/methylation domain-containing protein
MSRVTDLHTSRFQRTPDAGFTLMELLVALVVMATAISLLPSAFRAAQQALRGTTQLEDLTRSADVHGYLSSLIASAMPLYAARSADGKPAIGFWGQSDTVNLIAARTLGPQGAGLYLHTLSITRSPPQRDGSQRSRLVLRVALYTAATSSISNSSDETVLLDTPSEFRFRYFGAHRTDIERQWADEWTRTDSLPELVELAQHGSASDRAAPLPLIIAPRLARLR